MLWHFLMLAGVTGTQCLVFIPLFLNDPMRIKTWECSISHYFNTSFGIFYTCACQAEDTLDFPLLVPTRGLCIPLSNRGFFPSRWASSGLNVN